MAMVPARGLQQPLLASLEGQHNAEIRRPSVAGGEAALVLAYQLQESATTSGMPKDMIGICANASGMSFLGAHEQSYATPTIQQVQNCKPKVRSGIFLPAGACALTYPVRSGQQSEYIVVDTPKSRPQESQQAVADPESLQKAPVEGSSDAHAMTLMEASFTAFNWTMNTGLLSVPFVFAKIGFSAAGLVVFIGTACTCTALLFGDVLDHLRASGVAKPTYDDAVRAAFGKRLAGLASIACYAELAVYVVNNVVQCGIAVKNLCPWLEYECIVVVSCLLSILCSAASDRAFAYVALISTCVMCTCSVAVIMTGWEMPQWAEASEMLGPTQSIPSSFSLILFGAAVHPLLPSLYEGTKTKHDYQVAVCNAWSLWGLFAILWASAIYYMFGDAVQPIVTCNIGRDLGLKRLPSLRWLETLASAWMCVRLQLSQPIFARPFVTILKQKFAPSMPKVNEGLSRMLLSIPVFMLIAAAGRLLEHEVTRLESVAGSLLMSLNALVIPSLSYLYVCQSAPLYRQIGATCLCGLGVILVMFSGFFPKLE